MDSAILSAAGIPTVIFGPGGEGAHAVVEWVDLEQVQRCAEVCSLPPKSSVADGSPYAGTTTRNLWLAMRAYPGVSPRTSPSSVTSCGSTLVVIITPRA